jgi:glycosyltransferase involved in cell wall biosynthesis
LAITYVLLPFYEKHRIPFTFVLYPGGGFGLNFDGSDKMLKKIFASPYFRGVIVTQAITRDYLTRKKLCPKDRIHYIYGGFVQFKKDELKPKRYFKKDKKTFDICFVAAKYSEKGVDKGYDLFIEAAKLLSKQTEDIMFHVIGDFDKSDIDISDIKDRVKFYGYRQPDFLAEFYAGMDIFLGPGRPFKLFEGNFDGFPLGIDAGYCGVGLFVSDELKINRYYTAKDIVIVPLSAKTIADTIMRHYNNLDGLYDLSRRGQARTQELFDMDNQINERIKVFRKYVGLEMRE